MYRKSLLLAAIFTAALAVSANAQGTAPAPQSEHRYHIEGKIQSIRPASKTAVVDAKAISGFMGAMAMPYAFKDSVAFSKLKVGDYISGEIVVSSNKSWIETFVVAKDTAKRQ